MWKVIQEILPILLVVLLISQYVVPVIFNKETWWLFKRKKKVSVEPTTLANEIDKTKIIVNETKAKVEFIQEKVKDNLKTAEDLKKEADKLI